MSFAWKSPAPAGLISFSLLLLSLPAFAQTTTIEGIVKDPDGKPIQGAIVKMERTDIKGEYQVKTDKKGHYGHYGLPMGTYNISVLVDGQVKDLLNNVRTTPAMPIEQNFDLKPPPPPGTGGPITAEQEKGMTKEQKEAYEKANKAREEQIEKNKALNDAYNAGKQALEAKMWDAAIDNLTKASMLDDKQVAVWTSLADAYIGRAGTKNGADAAADYDKGFDAYRKAIELKPDDPAYYNNFALALAKDKKLDDAKANLAKAIQLDPAGAGKYYYNMGALLVNGGQNDAAGEEFKKAIDADPKYADAQYQYGVTLAAKASTDAAGKVVPVPGTIEALQKYLELKPDGQYAGQAKELIAALGGSISTTFSNPTAKGKKK